MRIVMYLARSLYIFISFIDGFKKFTLSFTKFNLFVWLFIYLFVFCFLFSSFLITLLKREVSSEITLFLRLKNFYPYNFRKLLHLRLAKADSSPLQHAWQRKAMNEKRWSSSSLFCPLGVKSLPGEPRRWSYLTLALNYIYC